MSSQNPDDGKDDDPFNLWINRWRQVRREIHATALTIALVLYLLRDHLPDLF